MSASQGDNMTTQECNNENSSNHPSVVHGEEDTPDRQSIMKRLRRALTALENNPSVPNRTLADWAKRLEDTATFYMTQRATAIGRAAKRPGQTIPCQPAAKVIRVDAISESTAPCGDVVKRTLVQHPSLIPCGDVDLSQHPALQKCLPPGFHYHVCSIEETQTGLDHTAVCATIRLTLKTKEEAKEWVLKTRCTPMTWRANSKKTTTGKRTICNTVYNCQHHVKERSDTASTRRTSKNTDCPAKMTVTVKHITAVNGRKSESKDQHMPQYPTVITLQNIHNHNIYSFDSMKHRDVGQKAIEALTKLFEIGHTPRSALSVFKKDLQAEFGENYVYAAADRATCPDLKYCHRLHTRLFPKEYSVRTADDDPLRQDPSASHQDHSTPLTPAPSASQGDFVVVIV